MKATLIEISVVESDPSKWQIQVEDGSNAYCITEENPDGEVYAILNTERYENFVYELDAKATESATNRGFNILFSVQDFSSAIVTGYYVQFLPGGVKLFESVSPDGVEIASNGGNFVALNTYRHIKVVRQYPNIKVYVDDVLIIDVDGTRSELRSGFIGIAARKTTACFDNISVYSVGSYFEDFRDGVADSWSESDPSKWQIQVSVDQLGWAEFHRK